MFPKMSDTSVYIPRVSCICPPTSWWDYPRPADRFVPSSYQITSSVLRPSAGEALCAPFKSVISISPSPLGLLHLSPAALQNQVLWGPIFPVLDPWAGEPNVGLRTLTPVGKPLQYNYSPVGHPVAGYGIWLYQESTSSSHLIVISSFCLYL